MSDLYERLPPKSSREMICFSKEDVAQAEQKYAHARELLRRVQGAMHYDISQYDPSVGIATWTVHSEEEIRAGRKELLDQISTFLTGKEQP